MVYRHLLRDWKNMSLLHDPNLILRKPQANPNGAPVYTTLAGLFTNAKVMKQIGCCTGKEGAGQWLEHMTLECSWL